ncbi:hypothetical protein Y032_0207g2006 [Ancylostoma ceylanicum]|uniref:Uncharacterized protein n=1 Tax=Ancylostoma ceylanicum TaxID=53326 RepID=A0A016SLN1_9BILA|nr:hypothetical protein Y032_0207g2006 [Ancylostoma ceylanicum]
MYDSEEDGDRRNRDKFSRERESRRDDDRYGTKRSSSSRRDDVKRARHESVLSLFHLFTIEFLTLFYFA